MAAKNGVSASGEAGITRASGTSQITSQGAGTGGDARHGECRGEEMQRWTAGRKAALVLDVITQRASA